MNVVAVCGAGAAGIAAALAADRAGADVVLLEASPQVGGTVADCLLHTLGGLFDDSGRDLLSGLPLELIQRLKFAFPPTRKRRIGRAWVLETCPHAYRQTIIHWLAETRIRVITSAPITAVQGTQHHVETLTFRAESSLSVCAVVDATGTAVVTRMVNPGLVDTPTEETAGGLVFRLGGLLAGVLTAPRNIAVVRTLRDAVARGDLPEECGHTWLDTNTNPSEAYMKMLVPLSPGWTAHDKDPTAKALGYRVFETLKTLPGFEKATVLEIGTLGERYSGGVRGEYRLTVEDVRGGVQHSDAAARCAWPMELWQPRGGVHLEYLPSGCIYDIPLRSLKVAEVDNLWVAGKCLSAEPLAQASARVAGTCWAMGEAAGLAAAQWCLS